ncbi:hypothetical protein QAD02_023126 [Eretmocerus hayati]|uniref:Uncharacterized protein n=1 Tax=Eretmocerus hayati TaxID=131215 RepID=A0ACC2PVB2_9HYME|nr:hypothetical protein QAD02_023126 [Eretmocerus hayati]
MGKNRLLQKGIEPLQQVVDLSILPRSNCTPFSGKHVSFPELSSLLLEVGSKLKKCNACIESLSKEDSFMKSAAVYREVQKLVTENLPLVFGPTENLTARIHHKILKDVFGKEKPEICVPGDHDSIPDIYISMLVRGYLSLVLNFISRILCGKTVLHDALEHNTVVQEAHDIRQKMLPKKNRNIASGQPGEKL